MNDSIVALEQRYGARNYNPLPVVLTRGQGIYVWDINDKRYIDMMSAYSAISHGHCHPELVTTLTSQAQQLAVTSRAYYSDKLGPFLQKACEMTGFDRALPMNSGSEAVETALKAVRKWGYKVKGVAPDRAEIIVCRNNFHGRTIAIVSMSTEFQYRDGFGPFPAGFVVIPYDDSRALQAAITPNTVAFLVEPIQGEGGILIPQKNYLAECAAICRENNVLFLCDEIQTGLGRTGKLLACQHDNVKPDGVVLGKALGGGLLAVSLFLSRKDVMDVFTPGDHGSTFGGNPLAAAVGLKALEIIERDDLAAKAHELGEYFLAALRQLSSPVIKNVRGKGLLIGIEINSERGNARDICMKLLEQGLLSKETHDTVIRLAPPLIITKKEIDDALAIIRNVFQSLN